MGILFDALVRMELYHWGAALSLVNMGEYLTVVQSLVVSNRDWTQVYAGTRLITLLNAVSNLVGFSVTKQINCQVCSPPCLCRLLACLIRFASSSGCTLK
jgi:hypothetical protein